MHIYIFIQLNKFPYTSFNISLDLVILKPIKIFKNSFKYIKKFEPFCDQRKRYTCRVFFYP